MDVRLSLPTEAINGSRCSLCKNFLSVPPIMVISEDGTEYKCGRCSLIENRIGIRSEALENILRHLLLPCTYGCQREVPWEQVKNHEEECLERTLQCPLYYRDCDVSITISKMEDHFNERHMNNIRYGNVVSYSLEDDRSIVLVVLAGEEMFFIYLFTYVDFFSFGVFSILPLRKYTKYNVKICSENSQTGVTYKNQEIEPYNERLHCYKCMESECHLNYHPYSEKYNKLETNRNCITKMNGEAIREILGSPTSFKFTIKLLAEENHMENEVRRATHLNSALRKSFECHVCHEYMLRPIYSCKTGHSVCDACKMWLDKCPACESEFDDSRNLVLEKMAEDVELPCHYEEQGCPYAGHVESLRKHQPTCRYRVEIGL